MVSAKSTHRTAFTNSRIDSEKNPFSTRAILFLALSCLSTILLQIPTEINQVAVSAAVLLLMALVIRLFAGGLTLKKEVDLFVSRSSCFLGSLLVLLMLGLPGLLSLHRSIYTVPIESPESLKLLPLFGQFVMLENGLDPRFLNVICVCLVLGVGAALLYSLLGVESLKVRYSGKYFLFPVIAFIYAYWTVSPLAESIFLDTRLMIEGTLLVFAGIFLLWRCTILALLTTLGLGLLDLSYLLILFPQISLLLRKIESPVYRHLALGGVIALISALTLLRVFFMGELEVERVVSPELRTLYPLSVLTNSDIYRVILQGVLTVAAGVFIFGSSISRSKGYVSQLMMAVMIALMLKTQGSIYVLVFVTMFVSSLFFLYEDDAYFKLRQRGPGMIVLALLFFLLVVVSSSKVQAKRFGPYAREMKLIYDTSYWNGFQVPSGEITWGKEREVSIGFHLPDRRERTLVLNVITPGGDFTPPNPFTVYFNKFHGGEYIYPPDESDELRIPVPAGEQIVGYNEIRIRSQWKDTPVALGLSRDDYRWISIGVRGVEIVESDYLKEDEQLNE